MSLSSAQVDDTSLAARFSAAGTPGRRTSMGSPPIKLDEVIGKLDQVFSISKPSMHVENFDLMNYNEDEQSLYDRLIGVEQDKQEWLAHGSLDIFGRRLLEMALLICVVFQPQIILLMYLPKLWVRLI